MLAFWVPSAGSGEGVNVPIPLPRKRSSEGEGLYKQEQYISWWLGQGWEVLVCLGLRACLSFNRPWSCWRLILWMETFLWQVYFQIWTLMECLAQIFCYFTRTGMEESIDFVLPKIRQEKALKRPLPVPEKESTLEIHTQRCTFCLCGKSLDVYELETSRFADWIDAVAGKSPCCRS